jgi:hypothetical protein
MFYGWRMETYLLNVQRDPNAAVTLKWPKPYIPLITGDVVMFACMALGVPRPAKPKPKHIPDPALSIFPRS